MKRRAIGVINNGMCEHSIFLVARLVDYIEKVCFRPAGLAKLHGLLCKLSPFRARGGGTIRHVVPRVFPSKSGIASITRVGWVIILPVSNEKCERP